jgi:hypothetical protein
VKLTDSGNGNYEQPPVGTHVARCIKVIDIGTQKGEYQGKVTMKRQVIIGWELPNELMNEGEHAGKPFGVSKFYTASLNEKANLRADLANWRGRDFTPQELGGFDSKNILGKTCMVSLTLSDKGKTRVTGVMSIPKGMEVQQQVNPTVYFSLDEFDDKTFDGLSDGFKKMIQVSPEYQQIMQKGTQTQQYGGDPADMDSDIPFANPFKGMKGYAY